MTLYRYICGECKSKLFLVDYKDSWGLMCPSCGMGAIIYDRQVDIVLSKGNSKRKTRYMAQYTGINSPCTFFLDGSDSDFISVKDMFEGGECRFVKNIQYFGIKINR